jgi:hypothetical protein
MLTGEKMSAKQNKKYRRVVKKQKDLIIYNFLLQARDMKILQRLKFAWYLIIRKGAKQWQQ